MPKATPARLSLPCPQCRVLLSPRIDETKLARLGAILKCHRCGFRIDLVAWLRDQRTVRQHDIAAKPAARPRASNRPPERWRPLWVTRRPQSGVRPSTDAQAPDTQPQETLPYDFVG